MKNFLLAMLILFAPTLYAADIRLAWDAPDPAEVWTAVRIYELVGSNYVLKGEVPGTATTFTVLAVQPGRHVYIARSYSDVWKQESSDSNQAITPNVNKPPANLTWTVVQE